MKGDIEKGKEGCVVYLTRRNLNSKTIMVTIRVYMALGNSMQADDPRLPLIEVTVFGLVKSCMITRKEDGNRTRDMQRYRHLQVIYYIVCC